LRWRAGAHCLPLSGGVDLSGPSNASEFTAMLGGEYSFRLVNHPDGHFFNLFGNLN
jgi:hypothetical protein